MRRTAILDALWAPATAIAALMLLVLLVPLNRSVAHATPLLADPGKTAPNDRPVEHRGDKSSRPGGPNAPGACGVTYGGWTDLPSLPAPRNQAMSASINDKFYVLGGYNSNYSEAANLYRLNTASPASGWTTLASMPVRAYGTQAVAIGNKIYVPGGYGTDGPIDNMQIYEAGANEWSEGAKLPTARGGLAAVAYNGKLYMFGGAGANNEPVSRVYTYDPATDTYARKVDMPGPAYNASAVVHNGRIYVIGGSGYYYAHFVYNPDSDQWLGIAPSPRTQVDRNGLLSFGGEIWVFGGSYAGTVPPEQTVQIYNPYTNTWHYGPGYNNPRTNTSAVALVNDAAYVAGGLSDDGNASTAVETISFTGTPCQPSCNISSYPDVSPGSTFYPYVHCLSCKSILGGYGNGNFGPGDPIKRGQLSKVVANAAGYDEDPGAQKFQDVPPGSTFFAFINRLASRNIISGYNCGGPGEPCGPGNLNYFRPNATASRGQIAKIVMQASPLSTLPSDPPDGDQGQSDAQTRPVPPAPFFADVQPGSPFYEGVQKLAQYNVVAGYLCGGPGEPCTNGAATFYFRPGKEATRGQVAKMVSTAFFPACDAP
ncbi:MAG: S-layer homology domain-containing protein [Chloroflexota bacterium]|nr:S-layer homology domain-containing protein [Chloroflexota bacterium]